MFSHSSLKRRWMLPTVQFRNLPLTMGFMTLIGLVLLLGGCAMVGPDYVLPTPPEQEKWLESEDPQLESKETDFSQWWTVFNDPILNTLVESAYSRICPFKLPVCGFFKPGPSWESPLGFNIRNSSMWAATHP